MDFEAAVDIVKSANKIQGKGNEAVKVVVRCRPLSKKEVSEGRKSIVSVNVDGSVVSIRNAETNQVKSFTFDAVYDDQSTQQAFYEESAYPLVEAIFEGYNATIFAYGQTGCGKTYTMQGESNPPELRGVIPLAFDHIFENINTCAEGHQYLVRASYLEIYNENIRDLLGEDSTKNLELKEFNDTVYVKDLTEVVVGDVVSMSKVMEKGFKNRTVASTLMNAESSRSHSIFTIVVEISERIKGEDVIKAGKLNLVDLAGSERQSKTGAIGKRLQEGAKINLSLSALGNVISALVDGKGKHIPYRDSKLTRLLQDSLGGNTKTVMMAALSPADYNYEESVSTLRYANRAKNIKNRPTVNEDPKDAKLREYINEIAQLKQLLQEQSQMKNDQIDVNPNDHSEDILREAREKLEKEKQLEISRVKEEAELVQQRAQEMMAKAEAIIAKNGPLAEGWPRSSLDHQFNNQSFNDQEKEEMGRELKEREKQIEDHKRKNDEMASILNQLNAKIAGLETFAAPSSTSPSLSSAAVDPSKSSGSAITMSLAQQKEHAEYRRSQNKLRAQKKKQSQLQIAQSIMQKEKEQMEEELSMSRDLVESQQKTSDKKFLKLKKKYDDLKVAISDLQQESQNDKEHNYQILKEMTQEIKLYRQCLQMVFTASEINAIYQQSIWSDELECWEVPKFHRLKKVSMKSSPHQGDRIDEDELPQLTDNRREISVEDKQDQVGNSDDNQHGDDDKRRQKKTKSKERGNYEEDQSTMNSLPPPTDSFKHNELEKKVKKVKEKKAKVQTGHIDEVTMEDEMLATIPPEFRLQERVQSRRGSRIRGLEFNVSAPGLDPSRTSTLSHVASDPGFLSPRNTLESLSAAPAKSQDDKFPSPIHENEELDLSLNKQHKKKQKQNDLSQLDKQDANQFQSVGFSLPKLQ